MRGGAFIKEVLSFTYLFGWFIKTCFVSNPYKLWLYASRFRDLKGWMKLSFGEGQLRRIYA